MTSLRLPPGPVDLSAIPPDCHFRGISGAARLPDGFVVGLQSNGPSKLLFLDDRLNVVRVARLALTYDIHSMLAHEGVLYIVSTGNDSVIAYDLASGTERVVRRFNDAGKDILHLNGLCLHAGRLQVSMFGEPQSRSLRCGRVAAVDSGETVLGGLRHPHSMASDGVTTSRDDTDVSKIVVATNEGRNPKIRAEHRAA